MQHWLVLMVILQVCPLQYMCRSCTPTHKDSIAHVVSHAVSRRSRCSCAYVRLSVCVCLCVGVGVTVADDERQGGFSGYDSDNSNSDEHGDVTDGGSQSVDIDLTAEHSKDNATTTPSALGCNVSQSQPLYPVRYISPANDALNTRATTKSTRVKKFRGRRSRSPAPIGGDVSTESGDDASNSDYEDMI